MDFIFFDDDGELYGGSQASGFIASLAAKKKNMPKFDIDKINKISPNLLKKEFPKPVADWILSLKDNKKAWLISDINELYEEYKKKFGNKAPKKEDTKQYTEEELKKLPPQARKGEISLSSVAKSLGIKITKPNGTRKGKKQLIEEILEKQE